MLRPDQTLGLARPVDELPAWRVLDVNHGRGWLRRWPNGTGMQMKRSDAKDNGRNENDHKSWSDGANKASRH